MNKLIKTIGTVLLTCVLCMGQLPISGTPFLGITAYAATTDISSGYSATLYPDNMASNTTVVYTGEAKTVKARVYSDSEPSTYLTEGTDYEISYANNINVGEATVTITGIGNYTGSFTSALTIEPMSLVYSYSNNYNVEMTVDDPVCVNKGTGTFCTPSVTVKYCGKALVKDRDYTLTYGNNEGFTFETNTNENTTKEASVTVTGMGNFTGSRTLYFNIIPYWRETEQVDSLYGTYDRDTATMTTATTAMPFSNDWNEYHLERFKIINLRYTSTVGGYTVPEGAFQGCKNLTEAVLSDGVETIGANAFKYCSKLRKVSYVKRDGTIVENALPDSLTTIGAGAFSDCPELTLNLPDNITSLANTSVFGTSDTGAKMLVTKGSTTEATIRATAASSQMYYYYKDYPDYQIVTQNSEYGNDIVLYAYRGNAANVTIPAVFDRIYCASDRSNFKGYQVKSITVPGNVKQIQEEAFQNCYGLRTLTIQPGNKLTVLPNKLFDWETNNFTFYVPDNITSFPATSDILVTVSCSRSDISTLFPDNEWKEDDGSGIGKRWSVTHTLTHHGRVESTETSEGSIEYWECSGCKKIFSDGNGEHEISKADTVIPKKPGTGGSGGDSSSGGDSGSGDSGSGGKDDTDSDPPPDPQPEVPAPEPEKPTTPELPDTPTDVKPDTRDDGKYDETDGSTTTISTDDNGTQTKVNEKETDTGTITTETKTDATGANTENRITETDKDGNVITETTETKSTDEKTGNVTEAAKVENADGSYASKETIKDADGNLLQTTEASKIVESNGDFVEKSETKDAEGNIVLSKEATQTTDADTGDVRETSKELKDGLTTESEKVTKGDGTGDFEAKEVVTDANGNTTKETTESKTTDENKVVTEQKTVVEGGVTTEEKSVKAEDGSGSISKTVEDASGKTSNEVTKGEGGVTTAIRQEDAPANGEPVVANYAVSGDSVSLSNVETNATEVAVSDKIPAADGKTYGVTEVGKGAFTGNKNLTAAAFGAGIKKLGKEALSGCKKLIALIFGVSDLRMNRSSVKGLSGKASNIKLGKNSLKGTSKKLIIGVENKADKKAVKKQLKKAGNKHAKVKIGYRLR